MYFWCKKNDWLDGKKVSNFVSKDKIRIGYKNWFFESLLTIIEKKTTESRSTILQAQNNIKKYFFIILNGFRVSNLKFTIGYSYNIFGYSDKIYLAK